MIVRIMGDNQYRLEERHRPQIAALDHRSVHADDHVHFSALLHRWCTIRDEELVASDLLMPAPDMTLHEAKKYLEQSVG
jgi:hypothetical protein